MTRNLRHALAVLASLGLIFTGVFLIASQSAYATTTPGPSFETCANLTGWYINPDETDRRPTATVDGLEFKGNDLIHHAADLALADLSHGTYAAAPAPDQTSFFSVEVSGDGKYGTLRWNSAEHYWEATSQGEQHHDVSAVALADAFPVHLSHHVVSFGVGYTNTPPGTVTTVVSSVTFSGKTYALMCKPVVESSSPAPVVTTTSPAPVKTTAAPHSSSTTPKPHTSSSAPAAGGGLPVTGPPVGLIVGGAVALLILGGAAYFVARRPRNTFQA